MQNTSNDIVVFWFLNVIFVLTFNLKLNSVHVTETTWPLEVAVTTYIKILWMRIPNIVMWSYLAMQNIVN